MTDPRFVLCPDCEGSGVRVVAGFPAKWPDGSENDIERPCSTCEGEGFVEVETLPVEVDDDQPSEAQEWADYDRDC